MTSHAERLEAIDEELSNLGGLSASLSSLISKAEDTNWNFVYFFSSMYTSHVAPNKSLGGDVWGMLFTYYQDLCENMPEDMAKEFDEHLEKETMSMDLMADYCRKLRDQINEQIEPLDKERASTVFSLARETMKKAA